MSEKLKVLVLGSGFAGQGHADAFRRAGAEVVGMVSRTKSVVEEVAAKMGIPYAGTDWQKALDDCNPHIVSIATPGGAHYEPIMEAMQHGCHVYCDKPLAESAGRARELCLKAEEKGVKTAYAASYRYMPEVIYAKELIAEGVIGVPREAESHSHFNLNPYIPLGWSHRIDQGGGRLNNNFTHLLSIMNYVLGERVLAVSGNVRNDMPRAPIVAGVHNFATRRDFIPEDLNDPALEWGDADVEWSYTVSAQLESELSPEQPVTVLFRHGGLEPRFNEDHLVFYGSEGAIYIKGHYGKGPLYIQSGRKDDWQRSEIPDRIYKRLPDIEDDTLRNWSVLADIFVRDLQGEEVEPYQTFEAGAEYQKIIDIIRNTNHWSVL